MANLRATTWNQTSISVVVDGLDRGAGDHQDINLYVDGVFTRDMKTVSGAGGSSGNYRTGVYTITGLSAGRRYTIESRVRRTLGDTVESDTIYITTLDPDPNPITIGNVNNLYSYSILQNRFSIAWDSATNATSYQVEIRVQGSSSWNVYYSGTTSYTFNGLADQTYYDVRVKGYSGTASGNYATLLVRTQSAKPSPLAWATRTTGQNFDLSAIDWNQMTSKINAWRVYQSKSTLSFTVANTGDTLTAAMFNQALNGINSLNPPYSPAAPVVSGEAITAAKINRISTSIDSLIQ